MCEVVERVDFIKRPLKYELHYILDLSIRKEVFFLSLFNFVGVSILQTVKIHIHQGLSK